MYIGARRGVVGMMWVVLDSQSRLLNVVISSCCLIRKLPNY